MLSDQKYARIVPLIKMRATSQDDGNDKLKDSKKHLSSVTRLGNFWNFMLTNYLLKQLKYLLTFWAILTDNTFKVHFRTTREKFWATFYSNIWSNYWFKSWGRSFLRDIENFGPNWRGEWKGGTFMLKLSTHKHR